MNVRRLPCLILFLALTVGAGVASGQVIVLKDGKIIQAKALRRQGNVIMATVPRNDGAVGTPQMDEVGYSLTQIARLEFPRPAPLQSAPLLILQGKPADALTQLEPFIRYYEVFLDAPGSWWPELALIKVQALIAMGNRKDAEPLVDSLARAATDPETVLAARAYAGSKLARQGQHAKAIEEEDAVLKGATNPTILAAASVYKGESHLALKQYDEAALAFLQIPVFYPNERLLAPQALLGVGRAFFALEDFPRARNAFDEIMKTYGATPQARDAQAELTKLARREKALSGQN